LLFIPEPFSPVLSPALSGELGVPADGVLSPAGLDDFGGGAEAGGLAPKMLYGSRTVSTEYTANGKVELSGLLIGVSTTPVEILTYIAIRKNNY
jgi:hypothetical protein